MNKKLVLSVLSTAVVASMASAAMAKPPGPGFLVGGDVDKYYSLEAFLGDHFDEALDGMIENAQDTYFVTEDRNIVSFIDAVYAKTAEQLKEKEVAPTKAHFGDNVYAIVGEEGKVYNPAEDDELPPGDGVPAEVVVESVSDISNTAVDVVIAPPQEDIFGATVEVKDNNGNIVEVNPTDISAGDTVASFTFKTPVEKLEGVWTVAGKEYSFTAIQLLKAITDAAGAPAPLDEVKLLNALNAAGIQNVDENKLAAYAEAIVDAAPATLAEVQSVIDEVNKSETDKAAEEAAVKAVVDAETQVQLLNALKAGFSLVNADWTVAYAESEVDVQGTTIKLLALTKDNSAGLTYKDVQDAIYGENAKKVEAELTKASESLKSADLATARTLGNTYLPEKVEGVTIGPKETFNDYVNELDAIIRVNTATTNNSLKNALVALDNVEKVLVEKYGESDDLDLKDVKDAYLADYRKAIGDEQTITNKNTRAAIAVIIDGVNANKASGELGAVTGATTADDLLKALKAYPGLKQVADINKDAYFGIHATNFANATNAAEVQAAVDQANLNAIGDATASNIIAKLNVFGLDNVVAANATAYLGAKATLGGVTVGATNEATVRALKAEVEKVNVAVTEEAEVKAINKATTAAEVKASLDKLAISEYLDVPSADRLFVANGVLKERGTGEFADKNEVITALGTVITAYGDALDGVRGITATAKITDVVAVLKEVGNEEFNNMSAAQQSEVAENFFTALEFDENGNLATQFRSLAAVNAALDAAK